MFFDLGDSSEQNLSTEFVHLVNSVIVHSDLTDQDYIVELDHDSHLRINFKNAEMDHNFKWGRIEKQSGFKDGVFVFGFDEHYVSGDISNFKPYNGKSGVSIEIIDTDSNNIIRTFNFKKNETGYVDVNFVLSK